MTVIDVDTARPDVEAMLSGLKPFQRRTVDHAFGRLWLAEDRVDRFLVADEVGLGKTLVAKGVAARVIDHLWDTGKPLTIVYICSNSQIARQNLQRLRDLTGGEKQDNADRLTLLPKTIGRMDRQRLNVISFTPGTSFRLGAATGKAPERVLLHWMVTQVLGHRELQRTSAIRYFACGAGFERFKARLAWDSSRPDLDPQLMRDFEAHLRTDPGPFGGSLLDDLIEDLGTWRGKQATSADMTSRRRVMIGALRTAMAQVSVACLSPDLVILDEFQRFKDLFPALGAGEQHLSAAQRLAQRIIAGSGTKTLILSATPYKMYTLPDEPSGEDHQRDFHTTVGFLAGPERAERVKQLLAEVREGMLLGTTAGRRAAEQATAAASAELRSVMSRTERLRATAKQDGMLVEKSLPPLELHSADLHVWMASDSIARHVHAHDVFEYWRSSSYPLNFMDPSSYQVASRAFNAAEDDDPEFAALLASHRRGLLSWKDVQNYRKLEPGNSKMRALIDDTMNRGVWRLAWIPPSMPYVEPGGVFAAEGTRTFTKRLVFSAWSVVPKTIAALVSYEAERRLVESAGHRRKKKKSARYDDPRPGPVLRFGWDAQRNRPENLSNLALLHPSVALARLGDPLEVARSLSASLPMDPGLLLDEVTARIQRELDNLGLPPAEPGAPGSGEAWYGVVPYLLDRALMVEDHGLLSSFLTGDADGATSRLADHLALASDPDFAMLGPVPNDLARVLALTAVAGPGVCALRALGRASGGVDSLTESPVRGAALRISRSLFSLFNRPEIVAAIRGAKSDVAVKPESKDYLLQVLRYCCDGNLQSVLDEYVHTLIDSLGSAADEPLDRALPLAEHIAAAATIRTTPNVVHDLASLGGHISIHEQRMHSHIAARFGRVQTSDAADARESSVRESFNSPFWPFVLASTSVGQEGLDFHTYSHSVVHWNLPSNPVDLEQREGRVHRYKGHAIRKNVAAAHGSAALDPTSDDPWASMFDAAEDAEPAGSLLISPYWVFEGEASIERYVPAMPLSREAQQYRRLQRTLGAYRSVMGQPRQEDLIKLLGPDAEWPVIDLTPRPDGSA
ncbi:helicase-related protein [Arthrobacter bussei]|uniref:DEAD/DEAH box helicase n=1 Tax=Arthrobacter bussei TaxID=2594179 RepID=A0A7X1TPY3_9MICC|nr:helicase-related protein [Arthrobacter bussei]MPY12098.1 DEAD/DEAH box helicase [Arthrobacter bussei]